MANVSYFYVKTEGEPYLDEPDGWRVTHIGAKNEAEARKVIDGIEKQIGEHHGHTPWKIVDLIPADQGQAGRFKADNTPVEASDVDPPRGWWKQ